MLCYNGMHHSFDLTDQESSKHRFITLTEKDLWALILSKVKINEEKHRKNPTEKTCGKNNTLKLSTYTSKPKYGFQLPEQLVNM